MRSLVAAILLLPAVVTAQASAPAQPPFKSKSGALIALSVADLAASTQWYQDKLVDR